MPFGERSCSTDPGSSAAALVPVPLWWPRSTPRPRRHRIHSHSPNCQRDIRPPDYATSFVRLATQTSALEHPITVASVNRPDWIEAVVREPGVLSSSLADALANYARA